MIRVGGNTNDTVSHADRHTSPRATIYRSTVDGRCELRRGHGSSGVGIFAGSWRAQVEGHEAGRAYLPDVRTHHIYGQEKHSGAFPYGLLG